MGKEAIVHEGNLIARINADETIYVYPERI